MSIDADMCMPIDLAGLLAEVGGAAHGGTAVLVCRGDGEIMGPRPGVHAVLADAERRFGAVAAVAWREGTVPPGEPALAVAAAAPHRAEAFAACRMVLAALAG